MSFKRRLVLCILFWLCLSCRLSCWSCSCISCWLTSISLDLWSHELLHSPNVRWVNSRLDSACIQLLGNFVLLLLLFILYRQWSSCWFSSSWLSSLLWKGRLLFIILLCFLGICRCSIFLLWSGLTCSLILFISKSFIWSCWCVNIHLILLQSFILGLLLILILFISNLC